MRDFYCPLIRLAIELDGGQHAIRRKPLTDERRTDWLASKGIEVLRFWNNDVTSNLSGVLAEILRVAELKLVARKRPPRQPSPLQGEGATSAVPEKAEAAP